MVVFGKVISRAAHISHFWVPLGGFWVRKTSVITFLQMIWNTVPLRMSIEHLEMRKADDWWVEEWVGELFCDSRNRQNSSLSVQGKMQWGKARECIASCGISWTHQSCRHGNVRCKMKSRGKANPRGATQLELTNRNSTSTLCQAQCWGWR